MANLADLAGGRATVTLDDLRPGDLLPKTMIGADPDDATAPQEGEMFLRVHSMSEIDEFGHRHGIAYVARELLPDDPGMRPAFDHGTWIMGSAKDEYVIVARLED